MLITLLIIGALIVLFGLYAISRYNRLVTLRNRFENAYAQIDVQLKRRYDLIPNLVETAKGFMKHERETLESVTQARTQAQRANQKASENPGDPEAMKELNAAEAKLTESLSGLSIAVEDYPELKSDTTMNQLMEELRTTENKVAFARQSYNDAVTSYNTARETFPTNVIANMFNFNAAELFEVQLAEEREAPEVSF